MYFIRHSYALLILGAAAAHATAASYQFVNIADTAGPLNPISVAAINNSGTVAFKAYRDAGGEGIFIGSGGEVTTLYDTSGPFREFGFPDINDSGTVAFGASLDAGGDGLFTGNGGPTTTIVQSIFTRRIINNQDAVAFSGPGGVFVGSGGPITTIADASGELAGGFVATSINDSGTVGFFAWLDDFAGEGVFIGSGGPTTTISLSGAQDVQINNAGAVAFAAGLSASDFAIYTGSLGSLTTLVDNSGPFDCCFDPYVGLNNNGQVAFKGYLDGGGFGIFTGPDPLADKVVQTGDVLFGSNVTNLSFQHGLNDTGDIVFYYELANGISGIAVAQPQHAVPGDYNADGTVNAADYVVWRKTDGTQAGYNLWRTYFGATVTAGGSPAGAITGEPPVTTAVPEPSSLALAAITLLGLFASRRPARRELTIARADGGRFICIADRTVAAVASASPGCRKGNLHMFAPNSQSGNQSINKCCSCVLGIILALSVMCHHVLGQPAPGVQEGDLFVGAVSPAGSRGVFRVRDGVVTPFSLGSADPNDPGFFDIPHGVIVDSQGRVVWLAPIGEIGARNYANHVGLFRASGEGATPERLAIFKVGDHALEEGYPNPFPDLRISQYDNGLPVIGLHLASNRRIEIDDDVNGGRPQVVTEEAYVMGLILGTAGAPTSAFTDTKTVSYGATTGVWDDSLPKPIYDQSRPQGARYFPVDMVSHAGAIYSIDSNGLRRSSTPLRVDASGSIDLGSAGNIEFNLGLRLFGGEQELRAVTLDDTNIPNVPCDCAVGAPDPPSHLMPWDPNFAPMSGFLSLAYDPGLGLVISSNAGFAGPYITRIGGPLLNDNPSDDIDAYFYNPFNDIAYPSLQVTRMPANRQFGDPDTGIAYPLNSSVMGAPGGGGLVAVESGSGTVVRVMENGSAEVLATGLIGPSGLGSYPTYSSTSTGLSVIIRVDSPVDVLLTAPDGRQIGVDLQTGLPVNDFGENGFDSGSAEPRFFAIRDSAPGDWSIEMIGTGDGPFAINVYGIDLDQSTGDRARMTGMASIGSQLATIFRLDAAATVELFPPGDYNLDGTVDAADYVVWRKNDGTQAGYDTWRANFGATVVAGGSPAGAITGEPPVATAIPEPSSFALAAACLLALVLHRRSRQSGNGG
ncbi:MAG: choice-of-anchor tandem repeat NxxGxxAF-containing protein [Pirellulales bacterium]